jgi:DNA polymerase-3 subunit epsilon
VSERQIVLDTETTGLELSQGHRVIEIGCIELVSRRVSSNEFHHYLNPEREIDAGALAVHGISRESLLEKPRFGDIAASLLDYLRGAELIIHNAEFDVGFLNAELGRAGLAERVEQVCRVTDTWQLARKLHPGLKNRLDALCKRYGIDNSGRELHGARLDARLLAEVYLAMTGGQSALVLDRADAGAAGAAQGPRLVSFDAESGPLVVVAAGDAELAAHRERLAAIARKAGDKLVWRADLATS